MSDFLRRFSLDQLSFWIGFFTGILFIWFFGLLRPVLRQFRDNLQERLKDMRQGLSTGIETHFRNDTLRYLQMSHIASPLFSLDEIITPPRLLAQPPWMSAFGPGVPEDSFSETLPYLPDWPELAANFNARTLTLAEALSGGVDLMVTGRPGSGKTVALAHLGCTIARRDPSSLELAEKVPVFIHAFELLNAPGEADNPLANLMPALSRRASSLVGPRLAKFLDQVFSDGRVVLLVDGLDEILPDQIETATEYLRKLLERYPETRLVVAASTEYFDGLLGLGLVPLGVAGWSYEQRKDFLGRWRRVWKRHISPLTSPELSPINPHFINGWLVTDRKFYTPLEFTLKVWSAYAQDTLGPLPTDAIEAYILRLTVTNPNSRAGLEEMAYQSLILSRPPADKSELQKLIERTKKNGYELAAESDFAAPNQSQKPLSTSQLIAELIETGLIKERENAGFGFAHLVIAGYLAAAALARNGDLSVLEDQPDWPGKLVTLDFLAAIGDVSPLASNYLERTEDPLLKYPGIVARWLTYAPARTQWRSSCLRSFVGLLRSTELPVSLRARFLLAMINANEPGLFTLLEQMGRSNHPSNRLLAALGLGLSSEGRAQELLNALIHDPSLRVQRAAILALIANGSQSALESAAGLLLHGDEDQRRTAAEALAVHPEEGYPVLRDGSEIDDLLVRRAIIYGLQRVKEPWARDLLKKIAIEEGQWVVRNAAVEALEALDQPDPYIPQPRPALNETAWLIAFAGERGIGISPGRAAMNLLVEALKLGDDEQKLAALNELRRRGEPGSVPALFELLYGDDGAIREAAYQTLWHISSTGVELPAPVRFGLGPGG